MIEEKVNYKRIAREEARKDAEALLELLDEYRKKYDADMVKIYFIDKTDYTLKFLKNGEKVKVIRRDNKSEYYDEIAKQYYIQNKEN